MIRFGNAGGSRQRARSESQRQAAQTGNRKGDAEREEPGQFTADMLEHKRTVDRRDRRISAWFAGRLG